VSPATADRLLKETRRTSGRGVGATRSGILLKHQIPVRTFADWDDLKPGFLEADLVAHCGTSTGGAYLSTLTLTDVATTWTECLALLSQDQNELMRALKHARRLLPFQLLGIDTDNGCEFINGAQCASWIRGAASGGGDSTPWTAWSKSSLSGDENDRLKPEQRHRI